MRGSQLSILITQVPQLLTKVPSGANLEIRLKAPSPASSMKLAAMAFSDKNVSIRRDQNGVWLIQVSWRISSFTGCSDGQQHFPLRAELDHLVATFKGIRSPLKFLGVRRACVSYPDVTFLVDRQPVWPGNQVGTKTLYNVALRIKFNNRVYPGTCTRVGAAAVARHRCTPSISTCTPLTEPQTRLSGSVPSLRIVS